MDEGKYKFMCCLVPFLFLLVVLVIVVTNNKTDTFADIGNMISNSSKTIETMFSGGKGYHSLNNKEDLFIKLKGSKNVNLIAITADWCGYCKKLKNSGVLQSVSKKYSVIELTDAHFQSKDIMKNLQAGGFPTLAIFVDGKMMPYSGPRDYDSIIKTLDTVNGVKGKSQVQNSNNKVTNNVNTGKGDIVNIPKEATKSDVEQQVATHKKLGHSNFCLMVLADWCGHCKTLKSSGLIEDLANKGVIVFIADDKNNITKELDIKGFPSVMVWKGDQLVDYNGPRDSQNIIEFMN
jgi:thiol-disulfide isomerase/thioredoxin